MAEEVDPAPDADAQKNLIKGIFKEAMSEFLEENKPDPDKTKKPKGGLLEGLMSFGN